MVLDNNLRFLEIYDFLIKANKKINLTTITEYNDFLEKNIKDSLSSLRFIKDGSLICDVGAGAGFPSIPLSLYLKNTHFVLIDSVLKKINYLNSLISFLDLKNVKTHHTRIETFANNHRSSFDYVVGRAVAPLNVLLEYSVPLLKVGGVLIAYKGVNYKKEVEDSKNALSSLFCNVEKIENYSLYNGEQKRFLLFIKKQKETPLFYPREKNKPRRFPL